MLVISVIVVCAIMNKVAAIVQLQFRSGDVKAVLLTAFRVAGVGLVIDSIEGNNL